MTETIFKNRKLNTGKLLLFGFEKEDGGYIYHTGLMNEQLTLSVRINAEEKIQTVLTDQSNGEEYVLHLVEGAAGAFVGQVKAEYEAILEEISQRCFDPEVFKGEQTKAVLAYAREHYGDEPEFLWQKFPDNAILRRRGNRKWYAALLTVSRRKLGFDSDETVEILDLRIDPAELETTVDGRKYFPGYHMNKKHWITLCLDGTVLLEEIIGRIDDSYGLAKK